MNKKIILGLGTMTVAMAPIIAVVSCGGGDDSTESGSGIRPIIAGAKVVTTNIPGIHFECSGPDNYMVIDGTKVSPEQLENIDPSTLTLGGGSAAQIQSMFLNHQMPVLRVINTPDSTSYYDVLGLPQPTLPQDQGVIPGTAQGNGVRGTTIQGYNGDIPYYNIDGKWYTDPSHMVAGTNAVTKIAKAGQNVYASSAVDSVDDINGVDPVSGLDVTTMPESISIDGQMYPKFTHVPSSTPLTTPGYFDTSSAITGAGATPFTLPTELYEVDGLFFGSKDEAALHMGYYHETGFADDAAFNAFMTREGITNFKVQETETDWRVSAGQPNVLTDARNSEYFSINRDSYGNCFAVDDNEKFARNLNQGDLVALNPISVDQTFKNSHPVLTISVPQIHHDATGKTIAPTETKTTYSFRTTIDGDALTTPGFFETAPQSASDQPFDLNTLRWSFEGKYYTSDDAFMNANGYQRREVYDNHGSQSFIDEVRTFVQATSEIPPKYNVGDKIFIDGVEYTIA